MKDIMNKKRHFQKPFAAALDYHMRLQGWTNTDMGRVAGYTDGKMLSAIRLERTDGAEDKRRAIAEGLGFTLDAFIEEGRRLIRQQSRQPKADSIVDQSTNVASIDQKHAEVIRRFRNRELALEINQLLVEIESMDPDELNAVASNLKDKKFRLEQEQKKSRNTGTGE